MYTMTDYMLECAEVDVARAVYWYLATHHRGQGSATYKALCELQRIYTPGLYETGPEDELDRALHDSLTEHDAIEIARAIAHY